MSSFQLTDSSAPGAGRSHSLLNSSKPSTTLTRTPFRNVSHPASRRSRWKGPATTARTASPRSSIQACRSRAAMAAAAARCRCCCAAAAIGFRWASLVLLPLAHVPGACSLIRRASAASTAPCAIQATARSWNSAAARCSGAEARRRTRWKSARAPSKSRPGGAVLDARNRPRSKKKFADVSASTIPSSTNSPTVCRAANAGTSVSPIALFVVGLDLFLASHSVMALRS
mmetsp:Transcript_62220/g.157179  ORF Transcript_62220/g.157179 Transcript_62220/m.157179 type:complete len:229 (-) Transcript_62220:163-849(-)